MIVRLVEQVIAVAAAVPGLAEGIVVDTHVLRVLRRFGFVRSSATAEDAYAEFKDAKAFWKGFEPAPVLPAPLAHHLAPVAPQDAPKEPPQAA